MEFSVVCPNDGTVEVGLADVTAIVVKGREEVDVVFGCPTCGRQVTISVRMPHVLLAAIEADQAELARWMAGAEEFEDDRGGAPVRLSADASSTAAGDAARIERYCEYFRRQLADAPDAEAMLEEMDSGR